MCVLVHGHMHVPVHLCMSMHVLVCASVCVCVFVCVFNPQYSAAQNILELLILYLHLSSAGIIAI